MGMRSNISSNARRFASRLEGTNFLSASGARMPDTISWIQSGGRSKSGSPGSFLRREEVGIIQAAEKV
jgi:hypothetical protein